MLSLLIPLLAALSPAALALETPSLDRIDSQTLLYDLRVGDRAVGTREVKLSWMATDSGEVRLIESYTELQVPLPTGEFSFVQRASARVSNRDASFTSTVSENGRLREVQARQRSSGAWKVTVIEDGELKQGTLEAGQVDLCSLELLDPVRHGELTGRARAEVLAAETGTLLAGAVQDLGEGTVTLGGQSVPVHRWSWTPTAGPVELAWSLDGVLVSYTSQWMGKELKAVLREPPPERSFGDIGSVPTVIDAGVAEQEL